MQDMEAKMETRVRVGGRNEDRTTGEMVWGEYVHTTARPVDGIPDPHLHAHCFVFNTTFDAAENRWKAGQFAGLRRDAPLYEAMFHARLARGLETVAVDDPQERRLFAIAAFNAGEGRVARAQARAAAAGRDPTSFGDVRPYLPHITQAYVHRVVAYARDARGTTAIA